MRIEMLQMDPYRKDNDLLRLLPLYESSLSAAKKELEDDFDVSFKIIRKVETLILR
jgi:hypothetical protein